MDVEVKGDGLRCPGTGSGEASRRLRAVMWGLVAIAAVYFLARGPGRAATGGYQDFRVFYTGAAAWVMGQDPYEPEGLADLAVERGYPTRPDTATMPQITTPLLFPLVAPWGALPWSSAKTAWILTNLLMCGILFEALRRYARFSWSAWQAPALLAATLGLGASHTGLANGQVNVIVTSLLALKLAKMGSGASVAAGAFFALGVALKPTMAAPYVLFPLRRWDWRLLLTASGAGLGILFAAVGWLELQGVPWVESWRQSIGRFAGGGDGDLTLASSTAVTMIHLDALLVPLGWSPSAARFTTLALTAVAVAVWWTGDRRAASDRVGPALASWGVLSLITLLCVYHRYYDATLLLFPIAWAIFSIARFPKLAALQLGLTAPMLAPIPATLYALHERGWIDAGVHESAAWQILVLRHQVWLLAAMLVVMFAAHLTHAPAAEETAIREQAQ